MKRDTELVRSILFAIEEAPFDGGPMGRLKHKDHTPKRCRITLCCCTRRG